MCVLFENFPLGLHARKREKYCAISTFIGANFSSQLLPPENARHTLSFIFIRRERAACVDNCNFAEENGIKGVERENFISVGVILAIIKSLDLNLYE
jgi:hypothetical protein